MEGALTTRLEAFWSSHISTTLTFHYVRELVLVKRTRHGQQHWWSLMLERPHRVEAILAWTSKAPMITIRSWRRLHGQNRPRVYRVLCSAMSSLRRRAIRTTTHCPYRCKRGLVKTKWRLTHLTRRHDNLRHFSPCGALRPRLTLSCAGRRLTGMPHECLCGIFITISP